MATAKAISDGQARWVVRDKICFLITKDMLNDYNPFLYNIRPSVLAKLCLGVACQMEECCTVLRSKGGIMFEKIKRSFLTHLTFEIQLFKALAHKVREWCD